MGNKIATEEDYWMCTGGIMPAQMQSVQLVVLQKDKKKYLVKGDTATSPSADFMCKWVMLITALIAAVIAVAILATGGAALGVLVMAGAAAGAVGAAVYGSVLGSLVCGQKAAIARNWLGEKNDLIIGGQKALTTGSVMTCPIFGSQIKHAPNVKNWWDALRVGLGNFGETVILGGMGGALIGVGGALASGAATLAAPGMSVLSNIWSSVTGWGMAVRVYFGANAVSNEQAMGQVDINNVEERDVAFGNAAFPEWGSMKRVWNGHPEPMDAMLLLYFLNLRVPTKQPVAPAEEPTKFNEEGKPKEEPTSNVKPDNESEPAKKGEDGKAYEAGKVRGVSKEDFFNSVSDFQNGKNPELAEEAWNLWSNKDWSKLERLFNENNLNGGWPPNRGFVSVENTTLPTDFEFDRYGGRFDESGKFKDSGTFIAERTTKFEDRALPENYNKDVKEGGKPKNKYKVVQPIENVKQGEAIPWFGQKGMGMQYELPEGGIDGLLTGDNPYIIKE